MLNTKVAMIIKIRTIVINSMITRDNRITRNSMTIYQH